MTENRIAGKVRIVYINEKLPQLDHDYCAECYLDYIGLLHVICKLHQRVQNRILFSELEEGD